MKYQIYIHIRVKDYIEIPITKICMIRQNLHKKYALNPQYFQICIGYPRLYCFFA